MARRNRPSKIDRIKQKRDAVIKANAKLEPPKPKTHAEQLAERLGPSRFDSKLRQAGSSKDRLKLGSYGVGFQGPRGFVTPADKVSKRETDGTKLVSNLSPRPTFGANASKRRATDAKWAADTLGYDYTTPPDTDERVMTKAKGRWRKRDLNPSTPKALDTASLNMDRDERIERERKMKI